MLTLIPFDAIVPEALVPAKAAAACTKSDPRLEAIAVVSALWLAVIEDSLNPKLIPLAFENSPEISVAAT